MKKVILLFITVVAIMAATNQTHFEKYTIKGTLTDSSGEPIIGAALVVKDTEKGTVTDFDGHFSLPSEDSCLVLVVSYVGYISKETEVCAGRDNKIVLEENGTSLDEVVVTALGSDRRAKKEKNRSSAKSKIADAPVSVESERSVRPSPPSPSPAGAIKSDELKTMSVPVSDALSGKVAGISISASKVETVEVRGSRVESAVHVIDGGMIIGETESKKVAKSSEILTGTSSSEPGDASKTREEKPAVLDDVADMEEPVALVEKDEMTEPLEESLSAGQLTAGEWSDLLNWEDWKNTVNEDLSAMESIWSMNPGKRYSVMVKNERGTPIPNAAVSLIDNKGKLLWQSKSNNTGRAELWYDDKEKAASGTKPQEITVSFNGISKTIPKIQDFEKGLNEVVIGVECPEFQQTEILFVVDATGSMGDEIRYLQAELGDVIKRVKKLDFIGELHTGSVFYRDIGDEYVVRTQNLSPDTDATLKFIARQNANGGGDGPEAVETAMEEAILNQKWSEDAVARIAFVVLDAQPHETEEIKAKMKSLAKKAAEKGIRIVPVLASGSQGSCEYLMRAMALTTNSRFLFLTDDSGIGNDHAEPSVGAYNVVFLNDLLFSLIVEFAAYENCQEENPHTQNQQATGSEDSFKASCYPQPANEYVFVDLENDVDKLEILDLQGQLLITKKALSQGISTVFIENLPPGAYIFKFTKGQKIQSVKVVKSGL